MVPKPPRGVYGDTPQLEMEEEPAMAAPVHHNCYGHCEKEVFDAKNAAIVPPIGVPAGAPALTAAQQTAITQDIERQFKGEIETEKCKDTDCSCNYDAQPAFPRNYDTETRPWEAEVPKPGGGKFKYTFTITVETASVTVTGKCKRKPGVVLPKGKTVLSMMNKKPRTGANA